MGRRLFLQQHEQQSPPQLLSRRQQEQEQQQERSKVVWTVNLLGEAGVKFFEDRKLDPENAARLGVYTASFDRKTKKITPSARGDIIVFPFVQGETIVADKYRAPGKRFWQRAGGKRIFYNWNALLDPALASGSQPLVIVEGEPDCHAAIDSGFPLTVSVPDGAPPVPEGMRAEDLLPLDPQKEASSKFDFMYEARDHLQRVKRFVIAVDNDDPGRRLAAELVRRLGAARCSFVTYPEGCKDLNDVLIRHGGSEVARLINMAMPYPVRGLYRMSEAPDIPNIDVFSTGWDILDRDSQPGRMKVYTGALMVVTGVPSSGKSTWVTNLLVNLARNYQWSSAIFSPEMPMTPHYRNKLRRIIDAPNAYNADLFIDKHFVFIQSDPTGHEDDAEMTLDWIIEKAEDALMRYGIKVLLIDPFNEIEHAKRPGESMTDYIARCLRALKRFARQRDVLVIIIGHPTKDIVDHGKVRVPTLYDIEASAHWFNKCDFGVTIERHEGDETSVHIQKVRFEETGERGTIKLTYDASTSRYINYRPPPQQGGLFYGQ